jgi:hypothetical protein
MIELENCAHDICVWINFEEEFNTELSRFIRPDKRLLSVTADPDAAERS